MWVTLSKLYVLGHWVFEAYTDAVGFGVSLTGCTNWKTAPPNLVSLPLQVRITNGTGTGCEVWNRASRPRWVCTLFYQNVGVIKASTVTNINRLRDYVKMIDCLFVRSSVGALIQLKDFGLRSGGKCYASISTLALATSSCLSWTKWQVLVECSTVMAAYWGCVTDGCAITTLRLNTCGKLLSPRSRFAYSFHRDMVNSLQKWPCC